MAELREEKTGFTLYPYQQHAIDLLADSFRRGKRSPILQIATGGGKCLGKGTPVLLADGSIVPVEDVKVGDLLASPSGKPNKVLALARGTEELYRVTPRKGDSYVVNASHLLSLKRTGGANGLTLSDGTKIPKTQEHVVVRADVFSRSNMTVRHTLKGWRSPVESFGRDDAIPPVPPYILGAWLGDGTKRDGVTAITKPEGAVVDEWLSWGSKIGCDYRRCAHDGRCPTWHLKTDRGRVNPALIALRVALGDMEHVRIPKAYLTAGWKARAELLAGLLDTDGSVARTGWDFISQHAELANNVAFVARSLGLSAYVKECVKRIKSLNFQGTYYRVCISGDSSVVPCRVKKPAERRQKKDVLKVGIKVEPIGRGEYFGFELDGDRLFMLGDFTVTHNTVVAAEITKRARAKDNRVLFAVPMIDLIDQTVERFYQHGLTDIGVIQADHPLTDYSKPIQIASVQTLEARGWPDDFALNIVDEAHFMRQKLIDRMTQSDLSDERFVGLSATPWAKGMGMVYDDLCVGSTMKELIGIGKLSDYTVYAPTHPDLRHVGIVAGDYNQEHLSMVMRDAKLVGDVVQNYIEHGEMRPAICFAVDRAHARLLCQQFNRSGIPAFYQDGKTPREERQALAKSFAEGRYRVACNVGTLTTGVDWDVRCIILARPTKSPILFVQMVGRGLRTAEGKDRCVIFDHTDTTIRLGLPADIHFDGLHNGHREDTERRTKQLDEEPKPKECGGCGAVKPPKVRTCPACGAEPAAHSEIEHADGELAEVGKPAKSREFDMTTKQSWYNQLTTYQKTNGLKPGWVYHKYKAKFGVAPANGMQPSSERVTPEVTSWIRSQNIRWAKSREKAA